MRQAKAIRLDRKKNQQSSSPPFPCSIYGESKSWMSSWSIITNFLIRHSVSLLLNRFQRKRRRINGCPAGEPLTGNSSESRAKAFRLFSCQVVRSFFGRPFRTSLAPRAQSRCSAATFPTLGPCARSPNARRQPMAQPSNTRPTLPTRAHPSPRPSVSSIDAQLQPHARATPGLVAPASGHRRPGRVPPQP